MSKRAGRPVQKASWYRDSKQVRQTVNARWTYELRMFLFNEVIKKERPLSEVRSDLAKMMKISPHSYLLSKYRLYNQIRLAKRMPGALSEFGKCRDCNHLLELEEVERYYRDSGLYLCTPCKEKQKRYKSKRRKEAIDKGICPVCYKRKLFMGYKTCKSCLSATHRRRILKGLCGACGKHKLSKKSAALCDSCLKKNRKK